MEGERSPEKEQTKTFCFLVKSKGVLNKAVLRENDKLGLDGEWR